ncbi:MAG: GAF domain-containing protein [Acidobacteria bacterium]|nr:GAF domain-containing protein [Acidobacteriota bacterium]
MPIHLQDRHMNDAIEKLHWQEFSQLGSLQGLLDDFSALTGISLVIMDADGCPVTRQTPPFNRLCMDLIKGTHVGRSICAECDRTWGGVAAQNQQYQVYTCAHGLVDFVSPIMFNGRILGYLFGGQLRVDLDRGEENRDRARPDVEIKSFKVLDDRIRDGELTDVPQCWHELHATSLGIDRGEYLKAWAEMPRMRATQIEAAARVLYNIANHISSYISRWLDKEREESGLHETIARLQREAATKSEIEDEVKFALGSSATAQQILTEWREIAPCRSASLQLVRGDIRTLLAGFGFDSDSSDRGLLRPCSRDPLVRRVVESREPLILSDTHDDQDWTSHPSTFSVRSWICLPIVHDGTVIGLLTADHETAHYYKAELRPALVAFGARVAPQIWHARLWNSAQRLIRDMEIVNEVVKHIGAKLDTDELLRAIVDQVAENLGCSHCTIFLPVEEDGETFLVPRVAHGASGTTLTRRFRTDEGLAGMVFTTGLSLVSPSAEKEAQFAPARKPRSTERSMLVAPIRVGHHTLGVVSADQDAPDWFTESDRRLVDALAQQAGFAMQRSIAVTLLQDIAERIIDSASVQDVLREVALGAIRLTNTTAGIIYLISEDGRSVVDVFRTADFDHPPPRLHLENGITRTVIRTGDVIRMADIQKDGRANPDLKVLFRAMIAIPLKTGERVSGVLYLNNKGPHDFTDTEVSLLLTLANQAAIAIGKAKLMDSLHQQLKTHAALEEVMQHLVVQDLDQNAALDSIGKGIRAILGEEVSPTINLYNEETDSFGECHAYGPLAKELSVSPRSSGGTGRYVLKIRQPLYLNDVLKVPNGIPTVRDASIKLGIKSFAAIPLTRQNSIVGVMFINSQRVLRFDETVQRTLGILASHAGVAIEIAQLHETAFYASLIKAADLGYLASGISHEFLNSLTNIIILEKRMRRQFACEQPYTELDLLRSEVDHAVRTIDMFTSFRDRGGVDEPTDLHKLIDDLIGLSGRRASDHGVFLSACFGAVPSVNSDSSLIQSIVVNLLRNAMDAVESLDATKSSRRIEIEVSCPDEHHFDLIVRDSGPGISTDDLDRIFLPYFTTKGLRNMGIGLFWVQRIVRRMKGRIFVDPKNEIGGATFKVRLPIVAERSH